MKKRDIIFVAGIILLVIAAHMIIRNSYIEFKLNENVISAPTTVIDLSGWKGEVSTFDGQVNFYNSVTMDTFSSGTEPTITGALPMSWWDNTDYSNNSPYGYGLYEWSFEGLNPSLAYGMKFDDIETAYNVYVNGVKLMSVGRFSTDQSLHEGNLGSAFVTFVPDSEGTAHIFVEVSNYSLHIGGMWNTVKVGLYDHVLRHTMLMFILEILLSTGTLTIFLLAVGFIIKDPKHEALPLLALLSFLSTVNSIFSGNRLGYYLFPDIPYALELRFEYLSGYLLFPIFVMLCITITNPKRKRVMNCILGGISLFLAITCLFLPQEIYIQLWYVYMITVAVMSVTLLVILLSAFKRNYNGKRFITLSLALSFIAVDKDLNYSTDFSLVGICSFTVVFLFGWLTIKQYMDDIKDNRRLKKKVNIDELTGLNNREYFISRLKRMKEEMTLVDESHKNSYVMFMDLDGLKSVNDRHSHLAGDHVIIEASRRIKLCLRNEDLTARYGGDEFLVMLTDVEKENAEEVAARIITYINQPIMAQEGKFQLGISIGIYRIDRDESVKVWIEKSDQAMYCSKENGRNRFTFYSDMDHSTGNAM